MRYILLAITFMVLGCSKSNTQDIDKKPIEEPEEETSIYSPSSTTDQIVKHSYYSLSYSEKDEQAEWVFYKLTDENLNGDIDRTDDFRVDPKVTTISAEKSDYYKSGYDRGHLAPAGSMKINYKSMSESFFLSNMSPQKAGFNRGVWKRLESEIRELTRNNDSLFVVSGPILNNPLGNIGANEVTVPSAYYKTILGYKDGTAKGLAFIIPHESSKEDLYSFAVSIDSVEIVTNIDFYQGVDKEVQDEIEKNNDTTLWRTIDK